MFHRTLFRKTRPQSALHRFRQQCSAPQTQWCRPDKTIELVSRAYHDSLFMARIASTGMIFIPCANGWSHRPDEYASGEDMADGIRVLALTMAELAESPSEDDLQSASRNEL